MAEFYTAGRRAAASSNQFTRRSLLLGGAQAAGFALVGWRLFDLQVVEARRYAPLAEENRISLQILAPKRGRILDGSGRVLADSDEIFRATVTPALAKTTDSVLRRVSHVIPLADDEIAQIVARTRKHGRNVPTTIATDLSFEQVAKLSLFAPSLPGVRIESAWRRRYHAGAELGHVVGIVGSVERFGIDDDAVARLPETRIGKSGAELGFDADLRGTSGTQKVEVDARGNIIRTLEAADPVPGRDVSLSIDADLQRLAVNRMQVEKQAAAVLLEIATGEIVVMASVPGFDPAAITGGISDADWQKLLERDDKPLLNRAIAGQYQPGSAFMPVTALAALQAGVVSPDEHVVCNGWYEYGGQIYRCSKPSGHGSISLHEAICSSCEVFFCEMSSRLGILRIAAAARTLGLGATAAIGLDEEKPGIVPDPDWKRGNLNAAWFGGETLLAGLGQGYMLATPLQLALMTARIASGRVVVPRLRKRDGGPEMSPFDELSFTGLHLDAVRAGMSAAVNDDGGSADKARLGSGKPQVAGETGVSGGGSRGVDIPMEKLEWGKRDHALFVGFGPRDAPRYAIATVIEHGGDGDTAALLARDLLNLAFDRDKAALGRLRPQGAGDPSPAGGAMGAG